MNPNDSEYDAWVATRQEENLGHMANLHAAATCYLDWWENHTHYDCEGEYISDYGMTFPCSEAAVEWDYLVTSYGVTYEDMLWATEQLMTLNALGSAVHGKPVTFRHAES